MSISSSAPRLSGSRVLLRAAGPNDYDFLYTLAVDAETGFRWRFRGGTPGPDEFRQFLWNQVTAQFVIIEMSSSRPIGVSTVYGTNYRDGWAYMALCGHPSTNGTGLATEGMILTVNYVFTLWDLHKIYFEIPEYNLAQIARDFNVYAKEEGVLTNHIYYNEERWDLHVFGISRPRWKDLKSTNAMVQHVLGLSADNEDERSVPDLDGFISWARSELKVRHEIHPGTTFADLRIDSLTMLEFEASLAELANNSVLSSTLGWNTTMRDAYLSLCEASSSPEAN